jgi:hypothetical protein
MNANDPVDRALASLAGRSWPGDQHNPQLEQQLMQNFATHSSASFLSRHRVLVPALIVLLVGGAAFAATGGYALVKSWFVTISVDGQVIHEGNVQTDERGNASFVVSLPGQPADGKMTLTMTGEGNPDHPETTVVTMTSEGDGQARVTIKPAEEDDAAKANKEDAAKDKSEDAPKQEQQEK